MLHMIIAPWALSPLAVDLHPRFTRPSDESVTFVSHLCAIELGSEAGSRCYEGKETSVCLLGSCKEAGGILQAEQKFTKISKVKEIVEGW